jgi:hypothetical protein
VFQFFYQKVAIDMCKELIFSYPSLLLGAILLTGLFNQDEPQNLLGFKKQISNKTTKLTQDQEAVHAANYSLEELVQLIDHAFLDQQPNVPIEIEWKVLMAIEYKLKYFEALETEMYAPVFSKAVEKLHEQEVIIKGYIIPFDAKGELLALSYYPYASCFFCGKASPASVISLYLKNKRKRYHTDDFIKFRGTLFLNYDDPNEFYYILRGAEEIKG